MNDYEVRYLAAFEQVLEQYLLSNELYWPPGVSARGGESPYPSLTPGSLCFFRIQARARTSGLAGEAEFLRIDNEIVKVLSTWQIAWEKKAAQDFHARLQLWSNYLDDFRERPEANLDRYPYEVSRRVQLELLQQEVKDISISDLKLLDLLDRRLKGIFQPGEFIWDPVLVLVFTRKKFWYLFGMIKDL
jgi:hypothetical protein